MKVAFIIVTFHTPIAQLESLKKEIVGFGLDSFAIEVVDNSIHNLGYAAAVNIGISKAKKAEADLYVILNPDISLKNISIKNLIEPSQRFDIWGYAMKQGSAMFCGGNID